MYARHLERLIEPCESLDAGDMKSISDSDYYRGGLRTPGTVMIQPAMLVRGIVEGLPRTNLVSLFEQSPAPILAGQGDR